MLQTKNARWPSSLAGGTDMPKMPSFNSKKESFYHDNSKCKLGIKAAPHNRVAGTAGKPLCKSCKKLNMRGNELGDRSRSLPLSLIDRAAERDLADDEAWSRHITSSPKVNEAFYGIVDSLKGQQFEVV
jgi:hypothetical protein